MSDSVRSAAREGVEFGVCAGLVFTLAELVTTLVQRQPVFYTMRQFAGNLVGPATIQEMSTGAVLLAGLVIHLAVSALFGVGYCLLNAGLSDRTQTRWDRQVVIGLLFGAAVWALKFQLAARYVAPGFVSDRPFQFVQLVLHTFFYGLPLALFYTNAERRLLPLQRALQGV